MQHQQTLERTKVATMAGEDRGKYQSRSSTSKTSPLTIGIDNFRPLYSNAAWAGVMTTHRLNVKTLSNELETSAEGAQLAINKYETTISKMVKMEFPEGFVHADDVRNTSVVVLQ